MTFQIETPTPYRMCKVCGRRLNRERGALALPGGGVFRFARWVHGGMGADHEAIPIMETAERPPTFICDLCSSPDWEWRVETESFEVPVSGIHAHSENHWLMCDPCYEAFSEGDASRLVDHVVTRLAKHKPEYRNNNLQANLRIRLLPMYMKLIDKSTGHADHVDRQAS